MPRTEEAEWWFQAVCAAIQAIPHGRCTTYGHIALLLGFPRRARQVGVCLRHLPDFDPDDSDRHFFHGENVPWHRVINSKGGVSPRGDGGLSSQRQVSALRAEGVVIMDPRGLEEPWVDLAVYGWFPEHLPGEEASEEDD